MPSKGMGGAAGTTCGFPSFARMLINLYKPALMRRANCASAASRKYKPATTPHIFRLTSCADRISRIRVTYVLVGGAFIATLRGVEQSGSSSGS